jgi:hypothetical protein
MKVLIYTLKNSPIGGFCRPLMTTLTEFSCRAVLPGDCVIAECPELEEGLFVAGSFVPKVGILRMKIGNCSQNLVQTGRHDWRFIIIRG